MSPYRAPAPPRCESCHAELDTERRYCSPLCLTITVLAALTERRRRAARRVATRFPVTETRSATALDLRPFAKPRST